MGAAFTMHNNRDAATSFGDADNQRVTLRYKLRCFVIVSYVKKILPQKGGKIRTSQSSRKFRLPLAPIPATAQGLVRVFTLRRILTQSLINRDLRLACK